MRVGLLLAAFLLIGVANGEAMAYEIPSVRKNPAYDVPFYTGAILPTPQEVKYMDEFAPMGRVGIVLGEGIQRDDARLAFLMERIVRLGGSYDIVAGPDGAHETFICVGDGAVAKSLCSEASPARPEGYLIAWTAARDKTPVAVLKGTDHLGLLWGITSLNQLITRSEVGRLVIRKATVRDYPDVAGKRVYQAMRGDPDGAHAWIAVQCIRANEVEFRTARQLLNSAGNEWWRGTKRLDEWKSYIDHASAVLKPLGIPWGDSIQPISIDINWRIRSKSDEDFNTLFRLADYCAERGGGFCLLYDDVRFPLHPDDQRDFGTGREADVYFLNRFYSALKAKHPGFRLRFCPPFYWGPASDVSSVYGESRDEYLSALGKRLPKDIQIYWTGPRVKSFDENPEDLRWITNMIDRKPAFWQNYTATSHGGDGYHFGTDPIAGWKGWYYDTFFDGVAIFTMNNDTPITNMILGDYLWNRKAYDPEKSIVEAGKKLMGPYYPKYVETYERLQALDEYGWVPTARAARNIKDVEAKNAALQKSYDELLAECPDLVKTWTQLPWFMFRRGLCMKNLAKDSVLKGLGEADTEVRTVAATETGVDADKGIILTPSDFRTKPSPRPPRYYAWRGLPRRFMTWVNGQKTPMHAMEAEFNLNGPPTGDYEVIVCGVDHNVDPPCRIRILANGNNIFEGENPFEQEAWTTHTFRCKGVFLKDNRNTLEIVNLEDSDNTGAAPWFMVNYVVVRPAEAK